MGVFGVASLTSLGITTLHLVRAIRSQTTAAPGLNRFAWPSVASATLQEFVGRAGTDPAPDAWAQVHELSSLARAKFHACKAAVTWFAVLVVSSFLCVTSATFIERLVHDDGQYRTRRHDMEQTPTSSSPSPGRSPTVRTPTRTLTLTTSSTLKSMTTTSVATRPAFSQHPNPSHLGS